MWSVDYVLSLDLVLAKGPRHATQASLPGPDGIIDVTGITRGNLATAIKKIGLRPVSAVDGLDMLVFCHLNTLDERVKCRALIYLLQTSP